MVKLCKAVCQNKGVRAMRIARLGLEGRGLCQEVRSLIGGHFGMMSQLHVGWVIYALSAALYRGIA